MRRRLLVKRRAFSLRISWNRCARSCARSALEESVAALMESWMLSAHLRGRRGSWRTHLKRAIAAEVLPVRQAIV
jgi:hypothetical protein